MSMAAGAVSLKKSHDIVILSFCNSQAKYIYLPVSISLLVELIQIYIRNHL